MNKFPKTKKIFALIASCLLLGLYLATLLSAILYKPATFPLFQACLAASVLVPILLYSYSLIRRIFK